MRSACLLVALLGGSGCATIPSGHAGVLVTATGGVQPQPLGEGMHVIPPLASVDVYNLRGQEHDEDLLALASDGAPVEARASLVTFHLAPDELPAFDREVGSAYYDTIVRPIVRATVRRVIAGYASFQLLDSKAIRKLQDTITKLAAERMRPHHVILDDIDLRTLRVVRTPRLHDEILATGVLEQRVLATPQLLAIARQKGDARRERASAVARAHAVVAPTLTPAVLADEARRAQEKLITAPSSSVVVGAPHNPIAEVDP